jgi:hypothetical protein
LNDSFLSFLRREWGATTFILTVVLGLVVVPVALALGNHSQGGGGTPANNPPVASSPRTSTPSASPTP